MKKKNYSVSSSIKKASTGVLDRAKYGSWHPDKKRWKNRTDCV